MARGSGFYLADAINNWGTRLERDRLMANEREQRLADRAEQRAEEERLRLARIAREDALIDDQRAYDETRRVQSNVDRENAAEADYARDARRRQGQMADQLDFEITRAEKMADRELAREAADYGITGDPKTDRAAMASQLAVARIARQVELESQAQELRLQEADRVYQTKPGQAELARVQTMVDAAASLGDTVAAKFDSADRALAERIQAQKSQAVLGFVNSLSAAQRKSPQFSELVKAISLADDKGAFFDQLVSDFRITDQNLIKGLQTQEANRSRLAQTAAQTVAQFEQRGLATALGYAEKYGGRVTLPISKGGGLGTGLGGTTGQNNPGGTTGAPARQAPPNFGDLAGGAAATTPQQPNALNALAAPAPVTAPGTATEPLPAPAPIPDPTVAPDPNRSVLGALYGEYGDDSPAPAAAPINDNFENATVGSMAAPAVRSVLSALNPANVGTLAARGPMYTPTVPGAPVPVPQTLPGPASGRATPAPSLPIPTPPSIYPAVAGSGLAGVPPAPASPAPRVLPPTGPFATYDGPLAPPPEPPIQRFTGAYAPRRTPLPGTGGEQAQRMQALNAFVREWLLENPPGTSIAPSPQPEAPPAPSLQRFSAPYAPPREPLPYSGGAEALRIQELNELVRQWLLDNPPSRTGPAPR